jgi:lipopolysaccharide export system protein LptA
VNSTNRSRDLYLQDQIEVEASDGFKIFTDQAQYSLPTKIMKVPQALRGASADGGIKVAADRAEAPIFSKTIKLFGNATGSFVEKKHGLTTVSADQAEMHRGTDDIKFESNVKLVQSKVEMTSKRATLNYAKVKKPSVQYLVARDDVVIKEKSGRFTRSQVAEFFATNDTIVLTGFPSVYDGEDAVTGDRITLYRSTGVVEATAANAAVGSPNMRPSQKNGDDDDNELAL